MERRRSARVDSPRLAHSHLDLGQFTRVATNRTARRIARADATQFEHASRRSLTTTLMPNGRHDDCRKTQDGRGNPRRHARVAILVGWLLVVGDGGQVGVRGIIATRRRRRRWWVSSNQTGRSCRGSVRDKRSRRGSMSEVNKVNDIIGGGGNRGRRRGDCRVGGSRSGRVNRH